MHKTKESVKLQRRCDRNRKRSKRRAIYCPVHQCYLDSVSQKHSLFAEHAGQLQHRGMSRQKALVLLSSRTTVAIEGEWLEAFWCNQCQETKWYHVRKLEDTYKVSAAPPSLWQQAIGVANTNGNPSVSEFTQRNARMVSYDISKDFWSKY